MAAENFECPVCLDADLNPCIITPCGHTVCGECVQKLLDPTRGIRDGREVAGAAKCPTCRGELKAAMITDYKHFCRVHAPEKLDPADRTASEEPDSDSDSDSDSEDDEEAEEEADDIDENGDLADFVVPDGDGSDYEAEAPDEVVDEEASQDGPVAKSKRQKKKGVKGKGKAKAKAKTKVTLAQLKKESLRNKAAKAKYLRRLRKNWISSAKIERTMQLVSDIVAKDPTEKILIFSQFTSLLDLLEVPIDILPS